MTSVNHYPVDIENLRKGDVISPDEICAVFGLNRVADRDTYTLRGLALAAKIEKVRRSMGRPVTARFTQSVGVKVLTDSEAAEVTRKRTQRRVRGVGRDHRNRLEINTQNLTADEQQSLDRDIIYGGRLLQAMKNVRNQCRLTATARTVPTLAPPC